MRLLNVPQQSTNLKKRKDSFGKRPNPRTQKKKENVRLLNVPQNQIQELTPEADNPPILAFSHNRF